jgi:hypothetical protein
MATDRSEECSGTVLERRRVYLSGLKSREVAEKCLDPRRRRSAWTRHDGLWAIYGVTGKMERGRFSSGGKFPEAPQIDHWVN